MPELRPCPRCNRSIPAASTFCPLCGADQPTSLMASAPDAPTSLISTGESQPTSIISNRPATTPPETDPIRDRLQAALGSGFELGEKLGQGAFGVVYRARDVRLKRDVAVKVLRRELVADPGFVQRFEREAQALAALRHPNIVPVYAIGDQAELIFLVMPFVEGMTLSEFLRQRGSLPLQEAERILEAVGKALSAAHAVGLVHRDIKPDNIMLEGPEHTPLLMDFGIAKGGKGESGVGLTSTGMVVGTPLYMSPEQATASPSVDARSDIYSLGVLAYQLFTGSLPFSGDSVGEVMGQHLTAPPPEARTLRPEIPQRISTALRRAMAKRPAERYQRVEEFIEALSGGGKARARRDWSMPGSRTVVTATLGILLLGLGGVVAWKGSAPVPRAPIRATLRAEGVRFRTATTATLWDKPLVLGSLGISGLDSVTLPAREARPAETVEAPTLFLRAIDPDSGGISVDPLRLPGNSVIGVKPTGLAGVVQLSLGDTVPSIPVSVSGRIAVILPDRPVDTIPFRIDQIQLAAPRGALDFELGFAKTPVAHPLLSLGVIGVSFREVNRFRDEEQAGDQEVSMITGGSIAMGHRAPVELAKGADLPLHGFQGTLGDLAVDSDAVALTLDGTVDSLPPALGKLPTVLEVYRTEHPLASLGAGVVYLGLLALVGVSWRRSTR
jgi:Protein kinase domain